MILDDIPAKLPKKSTREGKAAVPLRARNSYFAMRCRDAAVVLDAPLSLRVDKLLSWLWPPPTLQEAEALAALGPRFQARVEPLLKDSSWWARQHPNTLARVFRFLRCCGNLLAWQIARTIPVARYANFPAEEWLFMAQELAAAPDTPSGDAAVLRLPAKGVTSLGYFPHAELLHDIRALAWFPDLRYLNLSGCSELTSVDALPSGLVELNLSFCPGLTGVDGLPAGLQTLDLRFCIRLTCVDALPPDLQELKLSNCKQLTRVDALPAGLQTLDLNGCTGLLSMAALPAGLRKLNLSGCTGLTSVAALPAGLLKLELSGCTGLTSVAGLPAGVQTLILSGCTCLSDLNGLPEGLLELNIHGCIALMEIDQLPASLVSLDLGECENLARVAAWPEGLMTVDITNTLTLSEVVKAELTSLVYENGGTVVEENEWVRLDPMFPEELEGEELE